MIYERDLRNFLGYVPDGLPVCNTVHVSGLEIPFLFSRVNEDPVLTILFNGAVDRAAKPDGIVFQRSKWIGDWGGSVLSLADPTIVATEGMRLGWGQTPIGGMYFPHAAARIASIVSESIGTELRVYAGSSAGGYQAVAASLHDPGSWAWVNNAQFDWSVYEVTREVDRVVKNLEAGEIEDLRSRYAWRLALPDLQRYLGTLAQVHYEVNGASEFDMKLQYPVFERLEGELSVNIYDDAEAGHNPLPREIWASKLQGFLNEQRHALSSQEQQEEEELM